MTAEPTPETWPGPASRWLIWPRKTGAPAYLDGAAAIGEWVQVHCYDTRGAGGYTAGLSQRGNPLPYKATEHNVDLYALFTMLMSAHGRQRLVAARSVGASVGGSNVERVERLLLDGDDGRRRHH